jgi:hypothetical protein
MAFIEEPVDNVISQGFKVPLSVHLIILPKTCCGKNAEAAQHCHICQLLNVFQRSVTHSRVARAAHQAVTIKAGVSCVRVCKFSILSCLVLAVLMIYAIL